LAIKISHDEFMIVYAKNQKDAAHIVVNLKPFLGECEEEKNE
jgi:hypothetical protein